MYKGSGNLGEDLKVVKVMNGQTLTGVAALFNGASTSTSGIDTQGFNDALFLLNINQIDNPATMTAAIYESDVNSSASAVAITGADFGVFSKSNQGPFSGSVKCSEKKRYLFMRTQQSGPTASYSATVLLGAAASNPCSTSLNKFEV